MAKLVYSCDYCGDLSLWAFKSESKKETEDHEEICERNPANRCCITCSYYKDYTATLNFASGWWCELERQATLNTRIDRHHSENLKDFGQGSQSNCSKWSYKK